MAEFGMGYEEMVASVRPTGIYDGAGPLPEPKAKKGHSHQHE
jgi:hypothetical protein